MKVYQSKHRKLSGSSLDELIKQARREYHIIQNRTPRRVPYVRSKYFTKDKVFINSFWEHLNQKNRVEQAKRLKFYSCALDLVRNNPYDPETVFSKENKGIELHRFTGLTYDGERFYVQIKQNKKTGRKDFMSVFPARKPRK